jgi:hypothetical protein
MLSVSLILRIEQKYVFNYCNKEYKHERGCDIRDFIDTYGEDIRPCVKNRTNTFLDKLETDRQYYKKKSILLKTLIYDNTKNINILQINYLFYIIH